MIYNMKLIVDVIAAGVIIWCIYAYINNTNRVVSELIEELKKKRDEKNADNS